MFKLKESSVNLKQKIAIVDDCIKLADFQDRLLVELNDKTSFRILFSLKGVPTA